MTKFMKEKFLDVTCLFNTKILTNRSRGNQSEQLSGETQMEKFNNFEI